MITARHVGCGGLLVSYVERGSEYIRITINCDKCQGVSSFQCSKYPNPPSLELIDSSIRILMEQANKTVVAVHPRGGGVDAP